MFKKEQDVYNFLNFCQVCSWLLIFP